MLEESGRRGRREAGRHFEDNSGEPNRVGAAIGDGSANDRPAKCVFETGRDCEAVADGARFADIKGRAEIERLRVTGGVGEAEVDSRQLCVAHLVRVAKEAGSRQAHWAPIPARTWLVEARQKKAVLLPDLFLSRDAPRGQRCGWPNIRATLPARRSTTWGAPPSEAWFLRRSARARSK